MKRISLNYGRVLAGALLWGSISSPALAQTSASLGSFRPTVLPSEDAALKIYRLLPTEPFRASSGCFQRAHQWSYRMSLRHNVNSMKVFLFFTRRYQREFDYEWMYHVAPLVPVAKADGSVEDMVFDPTFLNTPSWATGEQAKRYADKPVPVAEWIRYFIFPNVECPLVENYADYEDYQERYYCYVMKTPMFTYIPENLEKEPEARTEWWSGDLEQMKKAYQLEYR